MHYRIANLSIALAFILLFGAYYQGQSEQKGHEKLTQSNAAKAKKADNRSTMSLTECQAIHDRIRKEKDDASLRKGPWLLQGDQKECPVFTPIDYRAMAKLQEQKGH